MTMKLSKTAVWKCIAIGGIILVIAIILLGLFVLATPLILLSMEDRILAKELDNRFINANYEEWKEETVADFGEVWIPEDWTLYQDSPILTITDANGIVVAYGTVFGAEKEPFSTYLEFMQALKARDDIFLNIAEDMESEILNPSEYGELTVDYLQFSETHYYLEITAGNIGRLFLVFTEDSGMNYSSVYEIAEAMIYSYHFY